MITTVPVANMERSYRSDHDRDAGRGVVRCAADVREAGFTPVARQFRNGTTESSQQNNFRGLGDRHTGFYVSMVKVML